MEIKKKQRRKVKVLCTYLKAKIIGCLAMVAANVVLQPPLALVDLAVLATINNTNWKNEGNVKFSNLDHPKCSVKYFGWVEIC